MSARILSSLTDDHPDMRKQVGCMTGIFQLLDRHRFLTAPRVGGRTNKKLLTQGGQHNMEARSSMTKMKKEKSVHEGLKGKQMVCDQSSSLGRYKTPSCSQSPKKQHSCSVQLGRQSPDLQDLLKHIDSPRPLKQSNSRKPEEDKDNIIVQCPRFSCDGIESRERLKATMKLEDIPRLSLDSGLRSIKSSASEFLTPTTHQESGCHKRSSSVVAKLMGLEGFPDSRCQSDSHTKMMSSTVFGEIEKRITQLEFKKSGKDLRALKQILEAMHKTSPRLECQKQDLHTNRNATYHVSYDQSPRLPEQQQLQHNHPSSTNKFNSSILIAKQDSHEVASSLVYKREDSVDKGRAKLAPKRHNIKEPCRCVPSVEKKTNGRTSKSVQEHNHMQVRSPGSVSPRLQDKKQGKDKQSSRVRRHQNKQPKPGPPNRRHKLKSNILHHDDDQLSETSSDTRNFTASVQSERNNCLVSYMEPEVTTRNHTAAIDAKQQGDAKEMNPAEWLGDDTTMTEFAMAPIEQPSPVSVLDAAFYIEDSPSPVKKISTAFRDYEPVDANEAEWHTEDLDCLPVSTRNLGSEYSHKKLEDIQHLVHKLSILNTDHEDSINQIASLCQSDNFDHQYIHKMILASGILKDLDCVSTTELHPSGNLINPELFHVLEPSNAEKNPLQFDQKIHRKIIFDTVNEILVHKLDLKGSLMPRRRCLSGQQLLKELYAEIDYLQPKSNSSLVIEDDELVSILNADMKHESEDWAKHHCEIPALVLSIERLIFKDLVTEVIKGDAEERSRGHCRQLFTH